MFEPITVRRPPAVLGAIQPNVILSPGLQLRRCMEGGRFFPNPSRGRIPWNTGRRVLTEVQRAGYSALLCKHTVSVSTRTLQNYVNISGGGWVASQSRQRTAQKLTNWVECSVLLLFSIVLPLLECFFAEMIEERGKFGFDFYL